MWRDDGSRSDRARTICRRWTIDSETCFPGRAMSMQLVRLKLPDASDIDRWKKEIRCGAEAARPPRRRHRAIEDGAGPFSRPSAMPSASPASSATRKLATCAWRESGLGRAIVARSMKSRPTLSKRLCGKTTSSRRRASAIHPRSQSCIRPSLALAVAELSLARAQDLRAAAATALRLVRDEIAAALGKSSPAPPDDMTLPQLEAWLTRRAAALEVRTALGTVERDLEEADATQDGVRQADGGAFCERAFLRARRKLSRRCWRSRKRQ